jgi:hypothetical protein
MKRSEKFVFPAEHPDHLAFLDNEHSRGYYRRRGCDTSGLAREAPFSEEVSRSQNRYNRFSADRINDVKFHTAVLNVHYVLGAIALREDGFLFSELANLSSQTGRVKKQFHIESTAL